MLNVQDDRTLLKQYLDDKDPNVLSLLMERNTKLVYGACYRVLGNVDDATDVTQDCFMQLIVKGESITGSVSGWLYQTANRMAINFGRKNTARKRHEKQAQSMAEADAPTGSAKEVLQFVDKGLANLPAECRDIIIQHYLLRKSQSQVAEELGLSQTTISRKIQTALFNLRKQLNKQGFHCTGPVLLTACVEAGASVVPSGLAFSLNKIALSGMGHSAATAVSIGVTGKIAAGLVLTVTASLSVYLLNPGEAPSVPEPVARASVVEETGLGEDGPESKTAEPTLPLTFPIEKELLELAQRGKFIEFEKRALAYPLKTKEWLRVQASGVRLSHLKKSLMEAINTSTIPISLARIIPKAKNDGVLIKATAGDLTFRLASGKKKIYFWDGLPGEVTIQLVEHYLPKSVFEDKVVMAELAEALMATEIVKKRFPERIAPMELSQYFWAALNDRSGWVGDTYVSDWDTAKRIREIQVQLEAVQSSSTILLLYLSWANRLKNLDAGRRERREAYKHSLGKHGRLILSDDFEEGVELTEGYWAQPRVVPPPGGATATNQFVLESNYRSKLGLVGGWAHTQWIDLPPFGPNDRSMPKNLRLSFRAWVSNFSALEIVLLDSPWLNSNFKYGKEIVLPVAQHEEWLSFDVDLSKPGIRLDVYGNPKTLKVGHPLYLLGIAARSMKPDEPEKGTFYIDDVRLFVGKSPKEVLNVERKKRAVKVREPEFVPEEGDF